MQKIVHKFDAKDFFNKSFQDLVLANDREIVLRSISENVVNFFNENGKINISFICTYNSRRSQIAQVWSNYAADFFEMPFIKSFSGGVSVASIHRNTVETLKKVGFRFQLLEFSHLNPQYLITYENCKQPIIAFSKLYDHISTNQPFFAVVMNEITTKDRTFMINALKLFHLPFDDPKTYDYTIDVDDKYMELNKQIAGEMYFLFKQIKQQLVEEA